ncbi:MAG: DUF1559 domain-containing protein, partial [Planctomycetota bacterium]
MTGKLMRRMNWRERAVIAAIVLMLLALLLPATQQASSGPEAYEDLGQIGLAAHYFHGEYQSFPSPAVAGLITGEGRPTPSWQTVLLPYLGEKETWGKYDLSRPFD